MTFQIRTPSDVPNRLSVRETIRLRVKGGGGSRNQALLFSLLLAGSVVGPTAKADGDGDADAQVNLQTAYYFTILSESGITDVPTSGVIGNVGTSPITGAADLLTCAEVRGHILSVDAAGPAPCSVINPGALTQAVADMQAAYTGAAARKPSVVGLGSGNIGGLTLSPGVYKWTSGVIIPTNLTLHGGPHDVWIFQIAQGLDLSSATSIILTGGALAKHVFWQVAGQTTIETEANFQGIVLCKTAIVVQTGATVYGRLYAQTAVTLDMNLIKRPNQSSSPYQLPPARSMPRR